MDIDAARIRRQRRCLARNNDRVRVLAVRADFHGKVRDRGAYRRYRPVPHHGNRTAAGVRRIEAVTGEGAMAIAAQPGRAIGLNDIAQLLKGDSHNLGE
ncbi:hypothetical protein MJ563_21295 [Klebsiella pneumoniae]|nr:hypothetical protein MJ563_21295 [Klebsiella pneumoniae]